jgi:hypothetical protein
MSAEKFKQLFRRNVPGENKKAPQEKSVTDEKANTSIERSISSLRDIVLAQGEICLPEELPLGKKSPYMTYRYAIFTSEGKQYLVSACLDRQQHSLRVRDFEIKEEGIERTLDAVDNSVDDTLKGKKGKRYVSYYQNGLSPEEQAAFLKEVLNSKIDMLSTKAVAKKDIVF